MLTFISSYGTNGPALLRTGEHVLFIEKKRERYFTFSSGKMCPEVPCMAVTGNCFRQRRLSR